MSYRSDRDRVLAVLLQNSGVIARKKLIEATVHRGYFAARTLDGILNHMKADGLITSERGGNLGPQMPQFSYYLLTHKGWETAYNLFGRPEGPPGSPPPQP